MRSNVEQDLYRFGAIGVRNVNTAVNRLAQCAKLTDSGNFHTWNYLTIAKLPDSTSPEEVKICEDILKNKLLGNAGVFESARLGRKDSFRSGDAELVLKSFRQVVAQYKSR